MAPVTLTYHIKKLIKTDYYPFGLPARPQRSLGGQTADSWVADNTTPNNYLYNSGSELNETTNNYQTFFRDGACPPGGREPALGRMTGIDIMAGKYSSVSPYNYAFNDPIGLNDPSGADPDCSWCDDPNPTYNDQWSNYNQIDDVPGGHESSIFWGNDGGQDAANRRMVNALIRGINWLSQNNNTRYGRAKQYGYSRYRKPKHSSMLVYSSSWGENDPFSFPTTSYNLTNKNYTYYGVANRVMNGSVTVEDLREWNTGINENNLHIGQTILTSSPEEFFLDNYYRSVLNKLGEYGVDTQDPVSYWYIKEWYEESGVSNEIANRILTSMIVSEMSVLSTILEYEITKSVVPRLTINAISPKVASSIGFLAGKTVILPLNILLFILDGPTSGMGSERIGPSKRLKIRKALYFYFTDLN